MGHVDRFNPKLSHEGDKPMYKCAQGRFVSFKDYRELQDEVAQLKLELAKAYFKLDGVIKDDGERYSVKPKNSEG
jgi:hypothetical protein